MIRELTDGPVPVLGLVTTNPPVLAGAFYAALDGLTAAVYLLFARPLGTSQLPLRMNP